MLTRLRSLRLFRVIVVFAIIAGIASVPAIVSACTVVQGQQSCSNNYSVGQTYFGSGGQLGTTGNGCSPSYCAVGSVGDLSDGNSTNTLGGSGNQVQAGSYGTISRNPSLALTVNTPSTTNLGYLNTSSVSTDTDVIYVQSYLAGGYNMQILGKAPTDNAPSNHTLTPITLAGVGSSAGTEQFGINLVLNTSPAVGAIPVCQATGFCNLSTITIPSNYDTQNKFYYGATGTTPDTIATSSTSSGQTKYTLSFIFNISTSTPAGLYTYNGAIIVTSTF